MSTESNVPQSLSWDLAFAKRHGVLLVTTPNHQIEIIHYAPLSMEVYLEIQRRVNVPFTLVKIEKSDFEKKLSNAFTTEQGSATAIASDISEGVDLSQLVDDLPQTTDILDSAYEAPVIRMINALLAEAIKLGASDIHFECFENNVVVRFRLDGILQEMIRLDRLLAPMVVSRIKVMAKLDIAERRVPQDGRITLQIASHTVDIRVSTIPTAYGERVVLRLLDKQNARLELTGLGFCDSDIKKLYQLLNRANGIILVTGPTGSGKTTTLYGALSYLNHVSRNILTVEDPIEYYLEGIGQTQVNTKVEMSFARGLRAILRQDPDIIMVGEIRDKETAEIAVQASLTGHLVLSTLHTNNALGAITRLIDMGVESFLLASTLAGLIAQRLVRVLCQHCRVPYEMSKDEALILGVDETEKRTLYHSAGCEHCQGQGYKGRQGIYEIIILDENVKELIHQQASIQEIERYVRKNSPKLYDDGCSKVLQGTTTIEELLRVTTEQ